MHALLRVVVKEYQQLRRDRKLLPAMVLGPLLQLLALGFAANTDVDRLRLLWVDADLTQASRRLLDRFTGSRRFELVGTESSDRAVERWLLRGDSDLALVVGEGFGRAIETGRPPRIQLLADGTDASTAIASLGYASAILQELAGEVLARRLELRERLRGEPARGGTPSGIELVPRIFYNPDLSKAGGSTSPPSSPSHCFSPR